MGDIAELVDVESIAEKLEYLYGTKQEIADAINEVGESQGVSVTSADTFRSYADKIRSLGAAEVGKISVRTTPLYDSEIGSCQKFEAPEGKVWKEIYVHIDAWSAVTQDIDPLIISENGYYDINDVSASKFAFSEVQNPSGNPKEKHYYEKYQNQFIPSEDTSVVEGKTYYVKDREKEYEVASSFIINVQRNSAAPFTCEFLDEDENVIETHNDIPYGGWCSYAGSTPVSKSGLKFQGWNPAPNNIQSNRKCHPIFFDPTISEEECQISWAEIVTNHGSNVPIGAWKVLPLKDSFITLPDGQTKVQILNSIMMQKVYNGEDVSTSTWLSKNTINFAYVSSSGDMKVYHAAHNYEYTPGDGYASWGEDQHYTDSRWINTREFLELFFDIIPDYIRQFIVPVTKYSTMQKIPAGNTYLKSAKTQDYIWVPSLRELNVPVLMDGDFNIASDRGPIYSDIFTDDSSRRKKYNDSDLSYVGYTTRDAYGLDYRWGNVMSAVIDTGGTALMSYNYNYDIPKVIGFCL